MKITINYTGSLYERADVTIPDPPGGWTHSAWERARDAAVMLHHPTADADWQWDCTDKPEFVPVRAEWTGAHVIMVDGHPWVTDGHHARRTDVPPPDPQTRPPDYLVGVGLAAFAASLPHAGVPHPKRLICDVYAPIIRHGDRFTTGPRSSDPVCVWRGADLVALVMPAAPTAKAGDPSPYGGTFRRIVDLALR